MTEALIGLLGVLVGALVSGGATYLMTKRSERLQAKASARLIEQELAGMAENIRAIQRATAIHRDMAADSTIEMDPRILRAFSPDLWAEHQGRLAETLSDSEWVAVSNAYTYASRLVAFAENPSNAMYWRRRSLGLFPE